MASLRVVELGVRPVYEHKAALHGVNPVSGGLLWVQSGSFSAAKCTCSPAESSQNPDNSRSLSLQEAPWQAVQFLNRGGGQNHSQERQNKKGLRAKIILQETYSHMWSQLPGSGCWQVGRKAWGMEVSLKEGGLLSGHCIKRAFWKRPDMMNWRRFRKVLWEADSSSHQSMTLLDNGVQMHLSTSASVFHWKKCLVRGADEAGTWDRTEGPVLPSWRLKHQIGPKV